MTVIAAEEPAWTCAAAWGSMRRIHPPRGPTEASHASGIDVARGCNGLCRTLALGVAARRSGAAARDAVAEIVTPVLSDIEADGTRRPRVEDPATDARASRPRVQGRVTGQANRKEERDADRRFTNTPLGKCQNVAATPADPHLLDGRRLAGDGGGRGRRGGDPSAQHAWRGGQRAGGRSSAPTPGQILHPGEFRPAAPRPARHRQKLAATAGHARLPLHLQPAAPAELVDRRLARLVLGGVRAGRAADRHCWPVDIWPTSARSPSAIPG